MHWAAPSSGVRKQETQEKKISLGVGNRIFTSFLEWIVPYVIRKMAPTASTSDSSESMLENNEWKWHVSRFMEFCSAVISDEMIRIRMRINRLSKNTVLRQPQLYSKEGFAFPTLSPHCLEFPWTYITSLWFYYLYTAVKHFYAFVASNCTLNYYYIQYLKIYQKV